MPCLDTGALLDPERGERAVSGDPVRARLAHAVEEGLGSFMESWKYSFFIPHVPSTAEHFSIVSTSAPVRRRTSADFVPMFCAFR